MYVYMYVCMCVCMYVCIKIGRYVYDYATLACSEKKVVVIIDGLNLKCFNVPTRSIFDLVTFTRQGFVCVSPYSYICLSVCLSVGVWLW